jgi:hypothetical protein
MAIPDAPYIREAETLGMPPYEPMPVCPVCGKECNSIFLDTNREAFGCEHCVKEEDSYEWLEQEKEKSRPDWVDDRD